MKLDAFATIALLAGLVFASSAYSQPAQTGGPDSVASGRESRVHRSQGRCGDWSKTTIRFGLNGMGVAPAGTKKGEHRTLFISLFDTDLPPLDKPIPNDENHLHFGGGQTEVELLLLRARTRCSCCWAMRTTSPHAARLRTRFT